MLMKKILLSISVLTATMMSANATDYVIFDSSLETQPEWTVNEETSGFKAEITVDGKSFSIVTDKANNKSNDLMDPSKTNPANVIRVYKASAVSINSDIDMKTVEITTGDTKVGELEIGNGWSSSFASPVITATNEAGAKTFYGSAEAAQVRIIKIVVSDEVKNPGTPEDPEPPTATEVNSIAEAIAAGNDASVKVNFPMTVAFVNKSNIFCQDAQGDFIQIYGTNTYEANDIIPAGWEATYKLYNSSTPELVPAAALPASTEKGQFAPKRVKGSEISVDMVNQVVILEDVTFAEATPAEKANFEGVADGVTLSMRNNYEVESVAAGTYSPTILVTVYNNAPSLYIISYTNSSVAVSEIEAAGTDAEYYDLNGVKVSAPETGLYIRVKDGKASKVIIR